MRGQRRTTANKKVRGYRERSSAIHQLPNKLAIAYAIRWEATEEQRHKRLVEKTSDSKFFLELFKIAPEIPRICAVCFKIPLSLAKMKSVCEKLC